MDEHLGKKWHRPFPEDVLIGTPFGVPGTHWKRGFHCGDDFLAGIGTPTECADGGVVEKAGDYGDGFGKYVKLGHDDGTKSYYCHLSEVHVALNDAVKKGQVLGLSGNSGNVVPKPTPDNPSAGAHLHFEVRKDGEPFCPFYEMA